MIEDLFGLVPEQLVWHYLPGNVSAALRFEDTLRRDGSMCVEVTKGQSYYNSTAEVRLVWGRGPVGNTLAPFPANEGESFLCVS